MYVRRSESGVGKEGGQTDRRRGWCSSVATGGLGGRATRVAGARCAIFVRGQERMCARGGRADAGDVLTPGCVAAYGGMQARTCR